MLVVSIWQIVLQDQYKISFDILYFQEMFKAIKYYFPDRHYSWTTRLSCTEHIVSCLLWSVPSSQYTASYGGYHHTTRIHLKVRKWHRLIESVIGVGEDRVIKTRGLPDVRKRASGEFPNNWSPEGLDRPDFANTQWLIPFLAIFKML